MHHGPARSYARFKDSYFTARAYVLKRFYWHYEGTGILDNIHGCGQHRVEWNSLPQRLRGRSGTGKVLLFNIRHWHMPAAATLTEAHIQTGFDAWQAALMSPRLSPGTSRKPRQLLLNEGLV